MSFQKWPKVEAVALGGSRVTDVADNESHIDLLGSSDCRYSPHDDFAISALLVLPLYGNHMFQPQRVATRG
jgi:hypothetical protein